ncbi:MAG: hypothetical protein KGZ88_21015 [Methylomicrobium sp.]|nr:hypothetical protein [Methylomicrobium sp.]
MSPSYGANGAMHIQCMHDPNHQKVGSTAIPSNEKRLDKLNDRIGQHYSIELLPDSSCKQA